MDSKNTTDRKFGLFYYDISISKDIVIDFISSDVLYYGIGLFHDEMITFITSDWTELKVKIMNGVQITYLIHSKIQVVNIIR